MPESFLGTGWSFPPAFDANHGAVALTSDEIDIQKSLNILFSTRRGERIMLPDYGCDLDEMVFEPINTSFKTYIAEMIRTAILHYEARIDLKNINIDDSLQLDGVIYISLDYVVRTTNSRFNYVYPYFIIEGTELKQTDGTPANR